MRGSAFRVSIIHFLLIITIGLLAYSNTFNVPFVFDDGYNISDNPVVKSVGNFVSSFTGYEYNPRRFVGYLTFALNYHFGGLSVTGYHIVNFAIHMVNGMLVYFLVILTFRTPHFSIQPAVRGAGNLESSTIALLSAILFVAHPIQTQAVTYIVQRFTSLATMFYLLSVVLYIRSRLARLNAVKVASFLFSLFCAVLAMKTKEIAFTLPIIIVLYEGIFFASPLKRRLLFLVPVVMALAIIPISIVGNDKPLGELLSDLSEKTRADTEIARWDYLVTEMRVLTTYVRLVFLPVNQNLDYNYPIYHSVLTPPVILSLLFLSALLAVATYLLYTSWRAGSMRYMSEDEGSVVGAATPMRYAYFRLVGFGILWFFVTLSVESSFIPLGDVIFEHRIYLPSVGIFIAMMSALSVTMEGVCGRWPAHGKIVLSITAFVILIMAGTTFARNRIWQDDVALWEDVVLKSPGRARGHNNLGFAYDGKGRVDRAFEEFRKAVALDPHYARPHYNMAALYSRKGQADEAIAEYEQSIALNPQDAVSYNGLGLAYSTKGEVDRAIQEFNRAVALKPGFVAAYSNLGNAYAEKGLADKAIEALKKTGIEKPDLAAIFNNKGGEYAGKGEYEKAIGEYHKAIAINPNYAIAINNLGTAYFKQGLLEKAVEHYNRAIKLNPRYDIAYNNLGLVYAKKGQFNRSIEEFGRAITMNPNYAKAFCNRGIAHLQLGNMRDAASDFRKSCDLGSEEGCGYQRSISGGK